MTLGSTWVAITKDDFASESFNRNKLLKKLFRDAQMLCSISMWSSIILLQWSQGIPIILISQGHIYMYFYVTIFPQEGFLFYLLLFHSLLPYYLGKERWQKQLIFYNAMENHFL